MHDFYKYWHIPSPLYLNRQLQAEQHSAQVFEDVDAAAREYWLVTGGDQEKLSKAPDAGAEPMLNEYCERGATQKEYELLFMVGGLALSEGRAT